MLLPRSLVGTLSIIIIFLIKKKTVLKFKNKQNPTGFFYFFLKQLDSFVPLLFNYGHYSLRTLFNHVQLKVHEGVIDLLISFFLLGSPWGQKFGSQT